MLDTPSPDDAPRRPDDRWGRSVDITFTVLALALLYAMFVMEGYETVPYHILFVAFAAVYGFRAWSLRITAAVLGSIVAATGAILVVHWQEDLLPSDELAEIILMPMILGAMVWHARRRVVALRQLEQLAAQERDRRMREHEFARDTSHALRTPLTIARGHIELIQDGEVSDLVRQDAGIALEELDRIGRMASRLLAIAELERPDALSLRSVDVAGLLRDTHSRWAASIPRQWSLVAPPELNASIDEDVLRIVVDALIENAVAMTTPNDHIRLICRAVQDRFVLGVADGGPGINAADAERVFQRFWRSAEKREGSGLGLSYVRAAAEAHGGFAFAKPSSFGGAHVGCEIPVGRDTGAEDAGAPSVRAVALRA
jgi:signal transduction histidine kinase